MDKKKKKTRTSYEAILVPGTVWIWAEFLIYMTLSRDEKSLLLLNVTENKISNSYCGFTEEMQRANFVMPIEIIST